MAALARDLRGASKELKKELRKGLVQAAKPAGLAVRQAYGREMPHRGGFAAKVGRSSIGIKSRTTGTISVSLLLRNAHDLSAIERGILRHPVFGNRDKWVKQTVPRGVGRRAFDSQRPEIQDAILAAIDRIISQIARG